MASWPTRTSTLSTGCRRSSSPPSAPGWPPRPRRVATMPRPNGFRRPANPPRRPGSSTGWPCGTRTPDSDWPTSVSGCGPRTPLWTGRAFANCPPSSTGSSTNSPVREDLTGTLQAAVADPQVRARLAGPSGGRASVTWVTWLTWVTPRAPSPSGRTESRRAPPRRTGAVAAAEDDQLSERRARRDAARQRRDVRDAERELRGAEGDCDTAEKASHAAAETLQQASARLRQG